MAAKPTTLDDIIVRDERILGGTPVFRGTRVPVSTIIDYLKAGDTLDEFLEQFPTVEREQAVALLELLKRDLIGGQTVASG